MSSKKEPTKEDLEREIEILKLKIRIAELEKELTEKQQVIKYEPIPIRDSPRLPKWPESPWYCEPKLTCFDDSFKGRVNGEEEDGS